MAYFRRQCCRWWRWPTIWLFFYTRRHGSCAGDGLVRCARPNWLGQQRNRLAGMMLVTVWKEAGFFMIFYLAALQTVSSLRRPPCWKVHRAGGIPPRTMAHLDAHRCSC